LLSAITGLRFFIWAHYVGIVDNALHATVKRWSENLTLSASKSSV
jgi:hypothetical protein